MSDAIAKTDSATPQRHFLTPPTGRAIRLPPWFKVNQSAGENYLALRRILRDENLHTVCEEGQCPNRRECWEAKTATFMILGDICTRSCGFCAVGFGRPAAVDWGEPARLAAAVVQLGLRHAVITSVNRDELDDGGASMFVACIAQIRKKSPCAVEILIPDFQGNQSSLAAVFSARPDLLVHNIETVPRLYPTVRPQAKYDRSLALLAASSAAGLPTKTGLMLGLGETTDEVRAVMSDLVAIGCDILTLGQYLQPTARHLPVDRFVPPDEFAALKRAGEAMGLRHVEAGPLVRSSYHAAEQIEAANGVKRGG